MVLLDCCHAAATAIQRNPTRAVLTPEQVLAGYQGQGRITLSSSDGTEKSVELGEVGHGAFTYYLQKGLRGDADRDGDGVVTADELWNYLVGKKLSHAALQAGRIARLGAGAFLGPLGLDLQFTLRAVLIEFF